MDFKVTKFFSHLFLICFEFLCAGLGLQVYILHSHFFCKETDSHKAHLFFTMDVLDNKTSEVDKWEITQDLEHIG